MRRSLQTELEASLGKLRQEAEEQLRRAEREREELQEELRSVQYERDQSLLQAETEKQQVRSEFCLDSSSVIFCIQSVFTLSSLYIYTTFI